MKEYLSLEAQQNEKDPIYLLHSVLVHLGDAGRGHCYSFIIPESVIPDFDGRLQRREFSLPSLSAFNEAISVIKYNNYDAFEALTLAGSATSGTDKLQSTVLESHKKLAFDAQLKSLDNSPHLIAALIGVATPEASAFLLAKPNLPNLKFNSLEFATVLRLRLRPPIQVSSNMSCSCKRHTPIDRYGDHLLVCKKGREVCDIQNSMTQAVAAMCRHSGLQVRVEPRNLFGALDNAETQRPDISLMGFGILPVVCDVGVSFPISSRLTPAHALIPGRSARAYATKKHDKYDDPASSIDHSFIPFLFEPKGYWHPEFRNFFDEVISHSSQVSGAPLIALRTYWTRRISATLQRAVARGIISRIKRLNFPAFFDEANYTEAIMDEADEISPAMYEAFQSLQLVGVAA